MKEKLTQLFKTMQQDVAESGHLSDGYLDELLACTGEDLLGETHGFSNDAHTLNMLSIIKG